jgi:hypothetical protein
MAVITLTTQVLRGVTVVTGGVAVQTRRGWGYQAPAQTPALVSMRHPSPGFPEPIAEPDQRRFDADDQAAAKTAATRAGRLSRCLSAGVLGSRTSAGSADRDSSHEWSLVKGGSRLSALWRTGPEMAGAMTSADMLNPGWSPSSCFSLPSAGRLSRRSFVRGEKRTESTGLLPVSGTPTASTRGKGVCYT